MCQPGRPLPHGLFPGRLAGLGGLPQGEVHRMFFGLLDFDARAGLHVVELAARELAVVLILGDAEIDIAVRGGVGVALVDQAL